MKDTILNHIQIDQLKKYSKEFTFNTQTEIIYAGHVPKVIYILLEGNISFYNKKNKLVKECPPNCIIGSEEFLHNTPYKRTALIGPGSKVLILDRSTVNTLINENFDFFADYQQAG
jgi:signal-transduction protein with cAMP-binding, CBS, and nucleotidyltransferase domain